MFLKIAGWIIGVLALLVALVLGLLIPSKPPISIVAACFVAFGLVCIPLTRRLFPFLRSTRAVLLALGGFAATGLIGFFIIEAYGPDQDVINRRHRIYEFLLKDDDQAKPKNISVADQYVCMDEHIDRLQKVSGNDNETQWLKDFDSNFKEVIKHLGSQPSGNDIDTMVLVKSLGALCGNNLTASDAVWAKRFLDDTFYPEHRKAREHSEEAAERVEKALRVNPYYFKCATNGRFRQRIKSDDLVAKFAETRFLEGYYGTRLGKDFIKPVAKTIDQIGLFSRGKFLVVAFGHSVCSKSCALTAVALGKLERQGFKIAVIQSVPFFETEAFNAGIGIDVLARTLQSYGSNDATTLYPLDRNGELSKGADTAACDLAVNLGAVREKGNAGGDAITGSVFLFGPDGRQISEALMEGPDTGLNEKTVVDGFIAARRADQAKRPGTSS